MAEMITRNYGEAEAKLTELGYTKCKPQHVRFPSATCACWHNGKESHVVLSKRGAVIHLEPMKEG